MVKVSIKRYEAPETLMATVEMEEGICTASPGEHNPGSDSKNGFNTHKTNTETFDENYIYEHGNEGWDNN